MATSDGLYKGNLWNNPDREYKLEKVGNIDEFIFERIMELRLNRITELKMIGNDTCMFTNCENYKNDRTYVYDLKQRILLICEYK